MTTIKSIVSGLQFDKDGELKSLDGFTHFLLKTRLRAKLEADSTVANDRWERLALWALTAHADRRFTPNSELHANEMAERKLETDAHSALHLAPTLPLARLKLAGDEQNAVRAEFLRRYELDRLPSDPGVVARATAMLREQKKPDLALAIIKKVADTNPAHVEVTRQLAGCLDDLKRNEDAFTVYEKLLALPDTEWQDFTSAGLVAATLGRGDLAREIFRRAEEKFPDVPLIWRKKAWALIDLNAAAEALASLQKYESMVPANSRDPELSVIAALAISRWLTGDKDGAVREYQKLLAAKGAFADAANIQASGYTEFEATSLLAVLAETFVRYPQLVPKPLRPPGEKDN